jgi:TPR repeat protein
MAFCKIATNLGVAKEFHLLQRLQRNFTDDVAHSRRQLYSGIILCLTAKLLKGHSAKFIAYNAKKILQHVTANIPAGLYWNARTLVATGQGVNAMNLLNRAIDCNHWPSRALKAWWLCQGREGIAQDDDEAFLLASEGKRAGCRDSQGVLAWCYMNGVGCFEYRERSLELAHESLRRGSCYGAYVTGLLLYFKYEDEITPENYIKSFRLIKLAASPRNKGEQGLDGAQCFLAFIYSSDIIKLQNYAKALQMYQCAANQGYPEGMHRVALYYHKGYKGVSVDFPIAIYWYTRAENGGHKCSTFRLKSLRGKL